MDILRVYVNELGDIFDREYKDWLNRGYLLGNVLKILNGTDTPKVIGICQMAKLSGISVELMVEVPASLTLDEVREAFLKARPPWNPRILLIRGTETLEFKIPY
jgi:hypothetical protein